MRHARSTLALGLLLMLLVAVRPGWGAAGGADKPQLRKVLLGAGVREILFAERIPCTDHWYGNFGFYAASEAERPPHDGVPGEEIPPLFHEGGRLCRYELQTGKRTVLLDDPTGGVRDPQLHYDGRTILFSYRRGGQPYYNLYTIQIDGTGLKQITTGPFDDIEPTWLPDDGIIFCSGRCNRYVNCHRTPVAILYRCDADGGGLRPLSTNIEHDNTPWPLPDGRVLYMRWEYVDRSQFAFHHLWTTNPDGTGQMVYYGNQFDGVVMLDAKPIPGTKRVVASFSPGHGMSEHLGHVTVVDPSLGPDEPQAARRISPRLFRDPYPIAAELFLVCDAAGIFAMDGKGNLELLYALPAEKSAGKAKPANARFQCHEPRPVVPRPREPIVASRVESGKTAGRLFLADVYHGRNMSGIARGEVRKLLVLEQLAKPVNFSGGMWPISDGGTFTLSRILGIVPVEPDGSAYFEVPAMRSLFFVALDKDDLAVKRMQSFVSVQPGETTGCVGCHEPRVQSPLPGPERHALLGRAPRRIKPIADVPDVFDFPRDIQPILDRHCLRCHNPDRRDGGADLSGDHTPLFCVSYRTILQHGLIADGRNERYGNRPPRTIGSSASRLLGYFDGGHHDVEAPKSDRDRLRLWIESSAVYAGTYASLGCGMYPVKYPVAVMERRCGACHGHPRPAKRAIGEGLYFRFGKEGPPLPLVHEFLDLQRIRGAIGYYKFHTALPPQTIANLSRPDKSLVLRAPLARKAGGLECCKPAPFADTSDPDYQAIFEAIREAKADHDRWKRFDMPGFRPNVYYIKKMQEYGVLPPDLSAAAPLDGYAIDRAYWKSLWIEGQ